MSRKYDVGEILDNGIDLFRLQGYNRTGINDLLRVSGIPKGSFYNFFDSKQDFGIQAVHQYSALMLNLMDDHFTDDSYSPLQRLRNFYHMVREMNINEAFRKGCLMCNLATELGATEPEIADVIEAEYERWVAKIGNCVAEGQAVGEITSAFPSEQLASFINNSYAGALVRMKAERSDEPMHTFILVCFSFVSN